MLQAKGKPPGSQHLRKISSAPKTLTSPSPYDKYVLSFGKMDADVAQPVEQLIRNQ